MLKELKNLFFVTIILLFVYTILKFYFSDDNKKKSFRSLKQNDQKILKIYYESYDLIQIYIKID